MVKHKSIEILTKEYNEMVKITDPVKQAVKESGVESGVAYVITAHTTTGITVNEGLECLESDIQALLGRIVPEDGQYSHGRFLDTYGSMAGNPTGHLKSYLTGNHSVFPVIGGKLKAGRAQDIYLCEFDGPQYRTVTITVIGE